MNKEFETQVKRLEVMKDGLLGGFIVQALKRENPSEYAKLMTHFMSNRGFVIALDEMIDACSKELWSAIEDHIS